MRFRGGEFSTGTKGNFQPELTPRREGSKQIQTSSAYSGYLPSRLLKNSGIS
jgi:hypothetical protein